MVARRSSERTLQVVHERENLAKSFVLMKCPNVGWAVMWAWLLLAGLLPCVWGSEESIVYFANGLDIQEVVAHASQPRPVVAGLADAEALDYDPVEDRIYWIDTADKRIRRAFSNGTGGWLEVVMYDLTRPAGIAVDPLGKNIFFSDRDQRRIAVATQTGQYRRILLWENLTSPEAVQLDPSRGLLFWMDTGPGARVERARMDGTERSVVINLTSPGSYRGLAIDAARQRLFWTRRIENVTVIEYCFYNGSGRAELEGPALRNSTPYAVTVGQDTLFWSQLSATGIAGSIFSRPMELGEAATLYENYSLRPYDITPAFTNHTFSESHPCMSDNGGCMKICVPLSSTERRCLCQSGEMEYGDNNGQCSSWHDVALVVGYSDQVRVFVEREGGSSLLDFQLPTEAANVTSIDYYLDLDDSVVVWSEDHSSERGMGVIKIASINSTGMNVTSLLSVAASSVSLHVYLEQVYWVDTVLGLIGVVDRNGRNPLVIFDEGLNSPRALVLNMQHSLLVWAELDDAGAAILFSPLNGGWKKKLYNLTAGSRPVAMAIDEAATTTLYWVDVGLKEIGYAIWNVSLPRRLVALQEGQYFSDISLRDGYLYLTDQSSGRIQRLPLGGENPTFEVVFDRFPTPRAIVANVDHVPFGASQCYADDSPCKKDHQLCFPVPLAKTSNAICECTSGYHLQHDVCEEDPSFYVVGGAGRAVFRVIASTQVSISLILPSYSLDLVAVHYRSRKLFWYDLGKKGIYVLNLEYHFEGSIKNVTANGSPRLVVDLHGSGPVGAIDVDWLGGNIFWTLPEEGRIDYVAVDGLGHRVFKAGLTGLTRLAVNSENRTLYWVQQGSPVGRVLFCKFDNCSTPQLLYALKMEGETVQKLFFEVEEKSLFSIVSSEGTENDTAFYHNFKTDQDLKLHKGVMMQSVAARGSQTFLLINQTNRSQYVCVVQQHTGCPYSPLLINDVVFHDITILSPISQRGFHVCQFRKAGCSHVCLPQQEGFVCQCPPHMVLGKDGKKCTDVEPFLLVSTNTELLLAPYQPGGSLSWKTLQALPFTGTDIQSIQYDPHFGEVFVLDVHAVTALHLGDWTQRTVVRFNSSNTWQWSRLQYDRLGGNWFWSGQAHFIEGVGRKGGSPEVFEYDKRTRFRDIAVDPLHGRLFWISTINYNSLEIHFRNLTPSGDIGAIRNGNILRRPHSLVYDDAVDFGNLFWVDLAVNTVYYYNFTSRGIHDLVRNAAVDSGKPLLRVAEDYVYWYEPSKKAVMKNKKAVSHQPSTAVTEAQGVTDFVFTLSHYPPSSGVHPCLVDEAPCPYWCRPSDPLALRVLPYQCICPYQHTHIESSQECQEPHCSATETRCRETRHCILTTSECDGFDDCPDGTDEPPTLLTCKCPMGQLRCVTATGDECIFYEERCSEHNLERCENLDADNQNCIQCNSTQFMCADKTKCVDINFRCELFVAHPDCEDGSDEMNCNITGSSSSSPSTQTIPAPQSVGDQPAILATSLLLSISTALVLVFVGALLLRYLRDKKTTKAVSSQNGSSARLTRMSVSTAQGGEASQSEGSFCSMSTLTRETHVSSATEPDMPFTVLPGLEKKGAFSGSDHSLETMVASDPPPSPITQKSIAMVPHPSIVTFDPEFLVDPEDRSYRAPNPSVSFSFMSDYDKISSVSEKGKPQSIHRKPPLDIDSHLQLQHFSADYGVYPPLSAGSPSDVVSLASNSHCTPPPPPSPVTSRSVNGEFHKDDINYSSSSTMV